MKVALFGGTFNPPHIGHIQICEYLLNEGFAQVWVIVCYRHPFGKRMMPFWDRFKMIRSPLRFLSGKVRVMDIERRLGGVSYSIRTLRYLKKRYPQHQFSWVVGGDNLAGGEPWRDEEKFKKEAQVLRIPRGKGSKVSDVSSQEIRDLVKGGKTVASFIPARILPFFERRRKSNLIKN